MCSAAETASDTLNDERDEQSQELKMPFVMTVKDHSATASAFAFDHMHLQTEYVVVVCFL